MLQPVRLLILGLGFALMATTFTAIATIAAEKVDTATFTANDWPWWRGPDRNGHADAHQQPPTSWSTTENIVWKSPVPGRGHSSPTVVGERVYLASADEKAKVQMVLCYDRKSGKQLWRTDVHQGECKSKNGKGSAASSTVACDGQRLFVNFWNEGAVYTTALDTAGKQLWQNKICDYVQHQGYGSSPAIYGPLVIVTADNKAGGAIAAFHREDGKLAWKHDRPKMPNYPSPIILDVAGKTQLLLTGCELVSSFDPLSGKKLWEVEGATTECVTSTVTDGNLIYSTGGYPKNHIAAYKADGTGELVWENGTRVYVPSMLVHGEYLYAVADAGVAMCLSAATGDEVWKARLGGTFSSSPVLVGNTIYATDEKGKTTIFKAHPDGFEKIAANQLGNQVLATPTIVAGQIFHRVVETSEGKRQEMLYCLGE